MQVRSSEGGGRGGRAGNSARRQGAQLSAATAGPSDGRCTKTPGQPHKGTLIALIEGRRKKNFQNEP